MAVTIPTEITDPVNARILAISEDRIAGFLEDPFAEIATLSGLPVDTVLERLRAMLESGVIRRIRQTLMATNLAPGALVVALGLDAHENDPYQALAVSTAGFGRILGEIARLGLPTVLVQEGGYLSEDLGRNLASALGGFEKAA